MRTAVLTVSTSVARRETEDESGPLLAELAEAAGADVEAMEVVPDDYGLIEDRLHHYVDDEFALIFTTGGTGLTPDDVTPEATRAVVERDAPGFAEAMRAEAMRHTPHGMLSRSVSGIRARTVVITLPGSPKACEEGWAVLFDPEPFGTALRRSIANVETAADFQDFYWRVTSGSGGCLGSRFESRRPTHARTRCDRSASRSQRGTPVRRSGREPRTATC